MSLCLYLTISTRQRSLLSIGHKKLRKAKTIFFIPTGIKPFFPEQKAKICRAHLYFAEQARTCKPWCRWPKKQNTKILPSSRPPTPTPTDSEN